MADSTYNPLNEFNTYSYHHFLVLVNSTEVANQLQDSSLFFQFATGEVDVPGARIVINPIRSMRFVINEISWTSWLALNAEEFGGTFGLGGEMTIIEPNGMGFMNELFDLFRDLDCGVATSQWILKTVFVGETGVGGPGVSSTEYINYVSPLTLTMTEMDISYDERGGEYKVGFVGTTSGGLLPSLNNTAFLNNTSIDLTRNGELQGAITLEQALITLEQHLNETIDINYEQFEKSMVDRGVDPNTIHKPRYVINIPEDLKRPEYIIETKTRVENMFTVHKGESLTSAIDHLINMCPALLNDCSLSEPRRVYRTEVAQVIEGPDKDTKDKVRVVCNITHRTIDDAQTDVSNGEMSPQDQTAVDNGNFLEYNYLYTGKNIDVLGFDMKMAGTGLVFMHSMIPTSGFKDDRQDKPRAEGRTTTSNVAETGTGASMQFNNPSVSPVSAAHTVDPTSSQAYQQLMQQHTILNVLATLKIRGNPMLLSDLTPIMDSDGRTGTAAGTSFGLAANFRTEPLRCKVNVKMPKYGDSNEVEDFWYRGSYLVLSAKNIFSGGEFSQELQMVAGMDGIAKYVPDEARGANQDKVTSLEPTPAPVIEGEPTTIAARVRAFLSTIRYCEGTDSEKGYQMLFSGVLMENFNDHPRRVIRTRNYNSSAAGAYQILTDTWDSVLQSRPKYKAKLPDFTPATQDQAGWCLLDHRKALPAIREGRIADAVSLCNKEWASLPGSPYGQPVKSMEDFSRKFKEFYDAEMKGVSILKADFTELV